MILYGHVGFRDQCSSGLFDELFESAPVLFCQSHLRAFCRIRWHPLKQHEGDMMSNTEFLQ